MGWHEDLELLATRRGGALVGYAYTLCGDVRQAEDLVQEALVRYCSRLVGRGGRRGRATSGMRAVPLDGDDGEGRGWAVQRPEAYVRRMVLNLYLDGWRRTKRWADIAPRVAVDDVPFPDSGITARADVVQALARLAPRQRAAVVLRYFEDMTIAQVADSMGTVPGTVKRYLHDALRTLRDVLEPVDATTEGSKR
ncbi:sigma-70 family RNA polymerase sigma factor [Promicromonospora sp. MEB111]|uniref:sigma-70 family RNA polymerase sigma factor n=1 Tax=unclassified Promicromonospora TaxID=2647929 RepID=UPI00254EA56E|nr:sigma-70 family RNA polymerase sigma factor [Promicromonospora sp. MEB111]